MSSKVEVQAAIQQLKGLWVREQRATREAFEAERKQRTLDERVELGVALRDVSLADIDAAPGHRTLLWLSPKDASALEDLRVSVGAPVRLWWDQPDSEQAVRGVVSRRASDKLAVMIDGALPERLEDGVFHLDRDEPQTTFERGFKALAAFDEAKSGTDPARLRGVFFGDTKPAFDRPKPWEPLDRDLNAPQRAAVERALCAEDVALVHGPPGTGKTRTLVELIRQSLGRGERVLATAASNTAVDNLAERLVALGVGLVRLGHPARISAPLEGVTLDALLARSEVAPLTKRWSAEAAEIRRRAAARWARGSLSKGERQDMLKDAERLSRDAREQLQKAQEHILGSARLICATAAGADASLLGGQRFDVVVLDEATQAVTPVALVALARARKVVLAGDPRQLPPTVVDVAAAKEGLGRSLFEVLAERWPEAVTMLTVQHRMSEALMAFPSASMYGGKLVATPEVAGQRLEDLGVTLDPGREGPLHYIDVAGRGWDEQRPEDNPSTSNPQQAERTAQEARRLLERGLPARDLAIITPYQAQARLLRDLLRPELARGLDVGTVDGFQGREKEAVIVDLVRSNDERKIGFLDDVRRMNVALTRARRFLLVLGDSATIGHHPYYRAFLAHAEDTPGAWHSAWED